VKPVTILVLLVNMTPPTVLHVQESETPTLSQVVIVHSDTMKIVPELVLHVTTLVKHVQEEQKLNVLHVLMLGSENKTVTHVHVRLVIMAPDLLSVLNVIINVLIVKPTPDTVPNVQKVDQDYQTVNVMLVPMITEVDPLKLDVLFVKSNVEPVLVKLLVVTYVMVTELTPQLVVAQQDSMTT